MSRVIVQSQYGNREGEDDYRRRLFTGDGARTPSYSQHGRRLFDDTEPVEIQLQRRVRFDDDMLRGTTRHQRSLLTADLSATKYDIGVYILAPYMHMKFEAFSYSCALWY